MQDPRIAFCASTLGVGGAEHVMYDLAVRLPERGYDCRFFLLRGAGPVGDRLRDAGVQVVSGLERSRRDPAVLLRLADEFRRFGPHIAFLLDHHNAIFWGGIASLIAGTGKRIVASHSTRRMGGQRNFTLLDRLILKTAARVVALSPMHATYLRNVEGIPESRLRVIGNGIALERYQGGEALRKRAREALGIGPQAPVVIMVAVLRPEKAHGALLEATRALSGTFPELKVLIVGDGKLRGHLESESDRLGIRSQVRFLGTRNDVPALLASSDVLVLPSHDAVETLPLAVLEAMAAGVPVVASAVGSLPDLIVDGVNGRLIAPADARGLADAVRGIIEDRQAAAKLVANAKETVTSSYSVDRMVDRYDEMFREIAGVPAR